MIYGITDKNGLNYIDAFYMLIYTFLERSFLTYHRIQEDVSRTFPPAQHPEAHKTDSVESAQARTSRF